MTDRWRDSALRTQKALELLGWPVEECLPGQPGAAAAGCSQDYTMHFFGYCAMLRAVADHHLGNVKDPGLRVTLEKIYDDTVAALDAACPH